MILTVYLALFAVAIVILAVGVFLGENYFTFVSLFFLFLLGSSLLFNGVDYETGTSITTAYTYVNGSIANNTATVTYAYTSLNDTLTWWFGFLMAIASGAGMAAILTQANRDFKAGKEYKRDYT